MLESGRPADARSAFESAIFAAPEFAPAYFMLGNAFRMEGRLEDAIRTTRQGLEHDPEDPKAYFNLGLTHYDLGDYERSNREFQKSGELDPEFGHLYFCIGRNWRFLGDRKREIGNYQRALEHEPIHTDAMLALGAAYALEQGDAAEDVDYIETGGSIDLADAASMFYLAMGTLALGELDAAGSYVGALEKETPDLAARLERHISAA